MRESEMVRERASSRHGRWDEKTFGLRQRQRERDDETETNTNSSLHNSGKTPEAHRWNHISKYRLRAVAHSPLNSFILGDILTHGRACWSDLAHCQPSVTLLPHRAVMDMLFHLSTCFLSERRLMDFNLTLDPLN